MDLMRLGSAGDPIARAQADRVRALLEARPEVLACVEMVTMSSDTVVDELRGLFGMLHDRLADAVVCPVERLPLTLPQGIVARAFVRDRSSQYRCVSKHVTSFAELRAGARVVVCDPVARAQILHRHPHLIVVLAAASAELLGQLGQDRWDAACLPAELLETGSLASLMSHPVDATEVIPAVGLGAVAVLVRDEQPAVHDLVRELNDPMVSLWLCLERIFFEQASGISSTVCAARAGGTRDNFELTGTIAELDGRWRVTEQVRGPTAQAEAMARLLAPSCHERAGHEQSRLVTP